LADSGWTFDTGGTANPIDLLDLGGIVDYTHGRPPSNFTAATYNDTLQDKPRHGQRVLTPSTPTESRERRLDEHAGPTNRPTLRRHVSQYQCDRRRKFEPRTAHIAKRRGKRPTAWDFHNNLIDSDREKTPPA